MVESFFDAAFDAVEATRREALLLTTDSITIVWRLVAVSFKVGSVLFVLVHVAG